MKTPTLLLALSLVLALGAAAPRPADAQFMQKLKDKAKERIDSKTDRATDKALDKLENAVDCTVGDDDCVREAKADGKPVRMVDEDGKPVKQAGAPASHAASQSASASTGDAAESQRPGEGAWSNYDFVPGERILFADDFSAERVGNFPRRLELVSGNMELVDKQGKRWLRVSDPHAVLAVPLPEALPRRFTMEFDITIPANWCTAVFFSEKATTANDGDCNANEGFIALATGGGGAELGLMRGEQFVAKRDVTDLLGSYDAAEGIMGHPIHVRLQVDGDYAKLYAGQTRVANVPTIQIPRGRKIWFAINGGDGEHPVLVSAISVNAGGRGLYDALLADGHVATQGILFDVGSDRIRPESTPTLKQIGDMLKEHPELNLEIQGHTDNTGQPAANRTLSEKRAAAVTAYLTSTFGIEASRLHAKGYGDTKPVAPNTTPEGRQQNRRVELVKL